MNLNNLTLRETSQEKKKKKLSKKFLLQMFLNFLWMQENLV